MQNMISRVRNARRLAPLAAVLALSLPAAAHAQGQSAAPAETKPATPGAERPEGPEHVDMSLLDGSKYVLMETSEGDFVLELEPEKAPISTANFLQYVRDGFYEGTIFHRVISTFMIQGGGFTEEFYGADGSPGAPVPASAKKETRRPIPNEAADSGLENDPYTIAYARTGDPHSATSQFFVNVADNEGLDPGVRGAGYAVFGKVVAGRDVVDRIRTTPTRPSRMNPRERAEPIDPVVIENAEIIPPERAKELIEADEKDAQKPEQRREQATPKPDRGG